MVYILENLLPGVTTAEAYAAVGAATTVAVVAPSSIGLVGSAGIAGQPGIVLGGGGVLPIVALTVNSKN